MSDLNERIEAFYRFLWPFLAADKARYAYLDEPPGGRPASEFLGEIPARRGVGPGSRLVDVGSGKGKQLVELSRRLGCHVIGLDPLDENLELAAERLRKESLQDRVTLLKGSIGKMPLEDASVDFVWCLDMFNHVEDIDGALKECARVLKPGGSMMNCSAVGSDLLEPREAQRVTYRIGINPDTLSPERMAAAYETAGLHVIECGTTTDEGSPFLEEFDEGMAHHALRFGKMLRARSRVTARLGQDAFELLSAYEQWNIFLLIGKLTYCVWVLERVRP
ncbi:class I SAM-dependent methyltransferase [Myxococcus sp. RHSTA-1-4]|uniref:class I SAM-dependent methyltransferase n=1 Tax=Myxococcus sp. RHSTA-1-4 TaxID=2874601 RepID=UPI001CC01D9D|nr:class I SAM-dependent methyltransferase [Myxococcus sp. RHSTA-1-4]MBZ4422480.1 methyltransferase domain-containing protein [Myxococcus sp. RHSTA-1-4]